MHLALQNEDLLHEIFWHLSAAARYYFPPLTSLDRVHSRALMNASLTCRLFSEPALDKLWWEIDTILVILGCLSTFSMDDEDGEGPTWYLSGPITSSDWQTLDKYAKRVRSLQFNDEENVDPSVYIQMLRSRPHTPLFPHLRNLHALVGTGQGLLICITPSLRRVNIDSIDGGSYGLYPAVRNLIDELPESAPLLEDLAIDVVLPSTIYNQLDRFHNLRSITILYEPYGLLEDAPTSFALLRPLSSLPHLYHLALTHGSPASPIVQTTPSTVTTFSSLTELFVSATWDQILPMLKLAQFDRLSFFALDVVPPHPWTEHPEDLGWGVEGWRKIFHFLHTRTGGLLKELQLKMASGRGGEIKAIRQPGLQIPLYAQDARVLRHLKTVNVTLPLLHSLTNEDVASLVDAWPLLESLRIRTQVLGTTDFSALVKIATSLPRLKVLGLSIKLDETLPDRQQIPLLSHPLKEFDPMLSSVDDPCKLAYLLDRLFPNLFTVSPGYNTRGMDKWEQVQDVIRTFHVVREDERMRGINPENVVADEGMILD